MRNIIFLVSLIAVFLLCEGCRLKQPDTLLIENHTSEIQIDGNIDGMEWIRSTTLTDLYSPWAQSEQDSTIFRCFSSQKYFNFCFEIIDRALTILKYTDKMTVAKGDRVELFFVLLPNNPPTIIVWKQIQMGIFWIITRSSIANSTICGISIIVLLLVRSRRLAISWKDASHYQN